ncbi:hypothetical protein [Paenibacillus glycanilyticus]|uniref:Uncharacterized protein n=1 Tax=Paenibacillus glycanilyticus TaxID=126569 RepID=A0ABQ6GI16_9BACL|nr:hypothetical protein [Paenibacillus glycanilyticus]GLX70514.1 hypothetical protein MU1_48600 [Paenibacillus glycanilyticus]
MKLYKKINYRLAKNDTPLVIAERVKQAFVNLDTELLTIKFFANDSVYGVSGINRVLKHFPKLTPYLHTVDTLQGSEQRLSNLPVGWDGSNPDGFTDSITIDDAIEVVRGVPRRYSLNDLTIIFDRLPLLTRIPESLRIDPVPYTVKGRLHFPNLFSPKVTGYSDYPSPCIRLQSDWWISGRNNFMDAIVELGDLADGIPQLELNVAERQLLESIGEIYHERVFAAPSNKEEAAENYEKMITCEKIIRSFYEEGCLVGVDYPYQLNHIVIDEVATEPLSVKKAITGEFKKRGFTYNTKYSNGGMYTISKITKNNYLVKITFARGSFDANVLSVGSIEGPLWKHEFELPATPDRRPYQLIRQMDVNHQLANIAAAYDTAEKHFIDVIDGLYGLGPSWLTYL